MSKPKDMPVKVVSLVQPWPFRIDGLTIMAKVVVFAGNDNYWFMFSENVSVASGYVLEIGVEIGAPTRTVLARASIPWWNILGIRDERRPERLDLKEIP